MWQARVENLPGLRGQKFSIEKAGVLLTYDEVLRLWREERQFRAYFTGLLADAPFGAFRFETPGVTVSTLGTPFEFVLLDCPGLDRPADKDAFKEHFDANQQNAVVTFSNLGRDAVMVVPCPRGEAKAYVHLAAFIRGAPKEQVNALWEAVGKAMALRVGSKPVWLSTAGAGVAWLHVRLDDRPKYYGYAGYRA